jgi:hypothetical protein
MVLARAILIGAALAAPAGVSAGEPSGPADRAEVQDVRRATIQRAEPVLVSTQGNDGCLRIRRKLWVEGDGWIVRRVSLCRY